MIIISIVVVLLTIIASIAKIRNDFYVNSIKENTKMSKQEIISLEVPNCAMYIVGTNCTKITCNSMEYENSILTSYAITINKNECKVVENLGVILHYKKVEE